MDPQLVNYNGQLINLNGGVLSNKFPIRDGLVYYVDAGIDKSYPDGGDKLVHLQGRANLKPSYINSAPSSTSLINGPTYEERPEGVRFDGINDYATTFYDGYYFDDNDPFTVTIWMKYDNSAVTTSTGTGVGIMGSNRYWSENDPGGWSVMMLRSNGQIGLHLMASGITYEKAVRAPDPVNWKRFDCYSFSYNPDASSIKVYLNGEKVTDYTETNATRPLNWTVNTGGRFTHLGKSHQGGWSFYHGPLVIGQVQMHNRVLSDDEISKIYNHSKQKYEKIIEEGLVLNLEAADYLSYSGTGTTWSDLSPSGNDATLVNGPTYQSDPAAIVFDGVNDRATTYDDNNVFQDNDPWTMIAAYKIDDLSATGSMGIIGSQRYFVESDPGGWGVVIQRGGEGPTQTYFRIFLTADDGVTQVSTQRIYQTKLECQRWYILAASYNPDTSSLAYYIDGQNQNVTGTNATANDGWTVNKTNRNGLIHQASQGGWNGIDWGASFGEVQVYKRVLTDDEIAYNFEARRGRYGI